MDDTAMAWTSSGTEVTLQRPSGAPLHGNVLVNATDSSQVALPFGQRCSSGHRHLEEAMSRGQYVDLHDLHVDPLNHTAVVRCRRSRAPLVPGFPIPQGLALECDWLLGREHRGWRAEPSGFVYLEHPRRLICQATASEATWDLPF